MPGGADKDGEEKRPAGKVLVVHTDMDTDLQDVVKTRALNAMKNFEKGELPYFMDVAKALKEQLDKHTPGTCWHVVVGKQFGSFVTNERKKCVRLVVWPSPRCVYDVRVFRPPPTHGRKVVAVVVVNDVRRVCARAALETARTAWATTPTSVALLCACCLICIGTTSDTFHSTAAFTNRYYAYESWQNNIFVVPPVQPKSAPTVGVHARGYILRHHNSVLSIVSCGAACVTMHGERMDGWEGRPRLAALAMADA